MTNTGESIRAYGRKIDRARRGPYAIALLLVLAVIVGAILSGCDGGAKSSGRVRYLGDPPPPTSEFVKVK